MSEENRKMILIASIDEKTEETVFQKKVPRDAIKFCQTIQNIIEDMGLAEDDEETPIPISSENFQTEAHLDKLIEYCEYMNTDEFPEERKNGERIEGDFTKWENDWFAKVDVGEEGKQMIFELIMAANYVENKPFIEALCKYVAGLITGKSPEEIREIFNIKNDFTPEEEEKIRKENEFIESATSN